MAKYHGIVGFVDTVEDPPLSGVYVEKIVKHPYSGDTLSNSSRWNAQAQVNDDLKVNLRISILADPYARQNFHKIKFVEYMGAEWKVSNVDVKFPRLILSLSDVYNG